MGAKDVTNQEYLRNQQYKTANNLQARINLHKRFSTNPNDWFVWVYDHLHLEPGTRVLEIGCGQGDLWAKNQPRVPADCQMTLTDLSEGMAAQARGSMIGLLAGFACTDAQALSFVTGRFDVVIANHMLYHVPDSQRALVEISRVLTPNGRFFAATNSLTHLDELTELINGFSPDYQYNKPALSFNLENGQETLGHYFSRVTCHTFPDALEVTEALSLAEYIRSMCSVDSDFIEKHFEDLLAYVQARLYKDGSIHISKSVGLLEAHEPRR